MALLSWLTIFALITVVVLTLDPLLEQLTLIPRLAVTTAVTVPLMTWLVMPPITVRCDDGCPPVLYGVSSGRDQAVRWLA